MLLKKNNIFLMVCFFTISDLLSFSLGYERFAQIELGPDLSRIEWYKNRIATQEKELRDAILAKLKVSDQEWAECLEKSRESVFTTEKEIGQQIQDIRGSWIADYNTGVLYKANGLSKKKLRANQVLFDIDDRKINEIKRLLKNLGYSGKVGTLYPDKEESLEAYQNLITIRPDLFLYDPADQAFRLRHELSHIQHQDVIFERAVKGCVQKLFRRDFNPAVHKTAEEGFDVEKLKQKNITLDDIDQIYDLLMITWWNFHEYRADMDALFAMKDSKVFKKKIKNQPQFNGYPLDYQYRSAYEKEAPVSYMQDFIEGLRNDSKKK